MTTPAHEELRRIAEAATAGPWTLDGGTVILSTAPWPMECGPSWQDWETKGGEPLGRFVAETRTAEAEGEANAEFIAAADPPTVLGLLARIEELEGALSALLHHEIAHVGPYAGQATIAARSILHGGNHDQ
jgi:hypothetical protein